MMGNNSMSASLTRGRRILLGAVGAIIVFLMVSPPDSGVGYLFNSFGSDVDGGAHKLHFFTRGIGSVITTFAGLVLIIKPSWALGSLQKFVATGVGFLIAAAVSLHVWAPVIIYPIVALIVGLAVYFAFKGKMPWQTGAWTRERISTPLLIATAVIAIPLIVYGLGEASLQRSSETLHGSLGHWGGGLANVVMAILLMAFAALRMPGWRVPAIGGAATLFGLGFASVYWPNQASSIGSGWGTIAIVAAVAFYALAEYENRTAEVPAASTAGQPAH